MADSVGPEKQNLIVNAFISVAKIRISLIPQTQKSQFVHGSRNYLYHPMDGIVEHSEGGVSKFVKGKYLV